MTTNITAAAVAMPVQNLVTAPTPDVSTAGLSSSSSDLDRLRSLVAGSTSPAGYTEVVDAQTAANAVGETQASEPVQFQTLGDSILAGISNFNSGYNESMETINTRLQSLSSDDPASFGNNFQDILSLQVDIARWSMSVMGVDNASKAGTNTVKELSKGG